MEYRIKQRREELHISQDELSKKSGVSRQIISNLETKPDARTMTDTLCKIAAALDCNVNDIFLD